MEIKDSQWALVGATVALGGYAFYAYTKRSGKLPPGPTRLPIFGTWDLMGMDETKFHLWLCDLGEKYGDIFTLYFGQQRVVVLNSYEMVREAFVTKGPDTGGRSVQEDRAKYYSSEFPHMKGIADNNMTEEWKRQRHATLKLLRSLGMGKHSSEHKLQEEAAVLITKLRETNTLPVDFGDFIDITIANIICSLLFGKRYEHDDKEFQEMMESVHTIFKGFATDTDVLAMPWLRFFKSSYAENQKTFYKAGSILAKFTSDGIKEGKKKTAEGQEPSDFVTQYLNEIAKVDTGETKITEDWLQLHLFDFFLAGSETTSTTLKWAMLFMAKNQNVQEKVHQELDSVIGKTEHRFSLLDRERLPYMEATIMEVQRRGSVAPIAIPHRATQDVQIGGYHIPKNSELWPNMYNVLNDARVWDSPDRFMPERFIGEDGKVQRVEQWIPFSVGRRTCIGEQLARQELFIIFTHIMHHFYISFPQGEPEPSDVGINTFALTPGPFKVCFKPRFST